MELVPRDCPVCGANDIEEIYLQPEASVPGVGDSAYVHRIVICRICGMVYANPIPSPQVLAAHYTCLSGYENPQHKGRASLEDRNKAERAFRFIQTKFPAGFKGRVLDIGCATGYALYPFKQNGWDVLGLDPSPGAADIARDLYDIEVWIGMFDAGRFATSKPFDLILLSHVIEHLVSPGPMVVELLRILRGDGLVCMETPDLYRPHVPMGYFTFEHLQYFSPVTLTLLMEHNGFTVNAMETFDTSPDIAPGYPVILATYAKALGKSPAPTSTDYDAGRRAVKSYEEWTKREIAGLQATIQRVAATVKPGRLALWGAGFHTTKLLALTSLSEMTLACIFDNDPKKHGKQIGGVEVVPFDNPIEVKHKVDAILISSRASENEIYQQISYLEDLGIRVFRLYESDTASWSCP